MSITSHQQLVRTAQQQLFAIGHRSILIDFFLFSMHNFFVSSFFKKRFKFKAIILIMQGYQDWNFF